MKLIVGGFASGKRAYAKAHFPQEVKDGLLIDDLHLLIKQALKRGEDTDAYVSQLIQDHPDAVILCDEIGLGIVPIDPFERAWREAVGRACCRIAQEAQTVIRVICGLGQVLK